MNLTILTGNLGRDPELRTFNGESVLSWSMGVATGTKDKPHTTWVECSVWGKRANSLQPYLVKGMRVTVSGPLKLEDYTAKDGTPKTKLAIKVDQVDLPPRDQAAAPQQTQQTQRPAPAPAPAKGGFDDMDDDIPF